MWRSFNIDYSVLSFLTRTPNDDREQNLKFPSDLNWNLHCVSRSYLVPGNVLSLWASPCHVLGQSNRQDAWSDLWPRDKWADRWTDKLVAVAMPFHCGMRAHSIAASSRWTMQLNNIPEEITEVGLGAVWPSPEVCDSREWRDHLETVSGWTRAKVMECAKTVVEKQTAHTPISKWKRVHAFIPGEPVTPTHKMHWL